MSYCITEEEEEEEEVTKKGSVRKSETTGNKHCTYPDTVNKLDIVVITIQTSS